MDSTDSSHDLVAMRLRLEFLEAAVLAGDHMHEIVDIVVGCADRDVALEAVALRFSVTRAAASALTTMQVYRLTSAERLKIRAERDALSARLAGGDHGAG